MWENGIGISKFRPSYSLTPPYSPFVFSAWIGFVVVPASHSGRETLSRAAIFRISLGHGRAESRE